MSETMNLPPKIKIGLVDGAAELSGRLDGPFLMEGIGSVSGRFLLRPRPPSLLFRNEGGFEISPGPLIRLAGTRGSLFTLERVTLGSQFHWERKEDLTFPGDLLLHLREDGTICAINEVDLEGYLAGVVSSEMNPEAPMEFLKAHAILSRSWLLAGLGRKGRSDIPIEGEKGKDEILRYYGRSEHDLYDVCSEDHCQRYQGVTKIAPRVGEAIEQTRGGVMVFGEEICDARYSKACGGITEIYPTAWEDRSIPYLRSISDGPSPFPPLLGEKEVEAWIRSRPEAYCNVEDEELLGKVLTETDLKTRDFFRWRVEYPREELEEILKIKSGIDFGALKEIVPLRRGPSGRISRLKIAGTKRTFVVGKELEIRRWLSRSHLYSSAFVVRKEADRFILLGAGWGHGVGLCQIGAAAMALKGCSAERILTHYFPGTDLKKIY